MYIIIKVRYLMQDKLLSLHAQAFLIAMDNNKALVFEFPAESY